MAKIGTLTLDLIANVSKWVAGLSEAEDKMGELRSKVNKFGPDVAKSIATGASAGAAALGVMIKVSADAGREIDAFTKSANVSAETLQKWNFAGATVGIEQVGDIFKDVSDRVGEFITTGGGAMNDWFNTVGKQAGLTAKDFANLSGDQALQKFVTVSQQAGMNSAQLSHMLQSVSGDADKLLPLLINNGAGMKKLADEAAALGMVLSDKEVFQLKGLSTSITKATGLFSSMSKHISAKLAPVLDAVINMFTDWTKSVGGAGNASTKVVDTLVDSFAFLANVLDSIGRISKFVWAIMKAGALGVASAITTLVGLISNTLLESVKGFAMIGDLFGIPGAKEGVKNITALQQSITGFSNSVTQGAIDAATEASDAFSAIAATPLAGDKFKSAFEAAKAASDASFAAQPAAGVSQAGVSFGQQGEAAAANPAADPRIAQLVDFGKTKQQVLQEQYEAENQLIADQLEQHAITEAQAQKAALGAQKKYQEAMTAISSEQFAKRTEAANTALSNLSTLMNSKNREMFEVGKAAAIAQTVISTYQGAQDAYKSFSGLGPWGVAAGIAAAAAAVAAGMARVQQIESTQFGGGSAGVSNTEAVNSAATPTGGGAGAAAPSTNVYLRGLDPHKLYSGEQILGLVNNELKNGGKLLIGAAA